MSDEDRRRFEPPNTEIPEAVKGMVQLWASLAEASAHIAHSKRTLFLAYVAEGFSEPQALELVKQP